MNWKDFFDSIGLNGTQWQWRIIKFQERWRQRTSDVRLRAENVRYEHRICAHCGALTDRDTKICPFCGQRLEHWRKVQIKRAFGMVLPGGITLSYVLMALNVAAMAMLMLRFGGMNLISPNMYVLAISGGLMPDRVVDGEWWRLISYSFLHGGILHILFNMSSLSQVGPITENEIGRSRFWVVYFLTAVGGALADIVWDRVFGTRPLVIGASGAIFGLIGFGLTFNHFYGSHAGRENARIYLQWAVYGFAFGYLVGGVDNVCHAGGFIVGALLGVIIERDLRHGDRLAWLWRSLAALAAMATVVAIGLAIIGARHFTLEALSQ